MLSIIMLSSVPFWTQPVIPKTPKTKVLLVRKKQCKPSSLINSIKSITLQYMLSLSNSRRRLAKEPHSVEAGVVFGAIVADGADDNVVRLDAELSQLVA